MDAEELPVEDPATLARAIDRVARGEVVHLVRDGRPVADLVPAGTDSRTVQTQHAAQAVTQRMADRFGAPTLAHYRQVYESCGQPWPGDEEIRRRFPVADASRPSSHPRCWSAGGFWMLVRSRPGRPAS